MLERYADEIGDASTHAGMVWATARALRWWREKVAPTQGRRMREVEVRDLAHLSGAYRQAFLTYAKVNNMWADLHAEAPLTAPLAEVARTNVG